MTIGQRLLELREMRGLKRQALSDEMGAMFPNNKLSRSAIEQLEKGISEPQANTILRLAQFFNVSADYLLTGASAENLGVYNTLALTDAARAQLEMQTDNAHCIGKLPEFADTISALMSDPGFFALIWGLIELNKELASLGAEIQKLTDKIFGTDEEFDPRIIEDLEQLVETEESKELMELEDRAEYIQWKYLESVDKVFKKLIIKL